MVEAQDRLSELLTSRTQMTIAMLIPYFDVEDLLKIYQLNKAFKAVLTPSDPKCLNYEVLCNKWLPNL